MDAEWEEALVVDLEARGTSGWIGMRLVQGPESLLLLGGSSVLEGVEGFEEAWRIVLSVRLGMGLALCDRQQ